LRSCSIRREMRGTNVLRGGKKVNCIRKQLNKERNSASKKKQQDDLVVLKKFLRTLNTLPKVVRNNEGGEKRSQVRATRPGRKGESETEPLKIPTGAENSSG